LDDSPPSFVLHAAKHVLLAVATSTAILVSNEENQIPSSSDSGVAANLASKWPLSFASVLTPVVSLSSDDLHVHLTTSLLEYPPATSQTLLTRVTRLSPNARHPALDLLRKDKEDMTFPNK
jgi:hypothetical protein